MQIDTKDQYKETAQPNIWQGISLTEKATQQLQKMLQKDVNAVGVRLKIKKSGCVGFGYVMELTKSIEVDDQVYEYSGVRVVVSPQALLYIDGTELDFVKEGLNKTFKFHNPKARHECGCGESFGV